MDRKNSPPSLSGHVVICNANEKVGTIADELHDGTRPQGCPVVLLCRDQALWEANPDWHPRSGSHDFHFIQGNPADPADLERVNMAHARSAIILADPSQGDLADARSTLVAVAIERANPQVHTIMELIDSRNRMTLRCTEVNEVVCLGELSEKLIAQSCITPGIKNIFQHLLSSNANTYQVFLQPLAPSMFGFTFQQLAVSFARQRAPFIACGFGLFQRNPRSSSNPCATATPTIDYFLNPRTDAQPGRHTVLHNHDRLILMARSRPDLTQWNP